MDKLLEYWEIIAAVFTGIVGYFSGAKIRKADALSNMQSAYNVFTQHQTEQLALIRDEINTVKAENSNLRNDIRQLQKDNTSLHKEINLLNKENNKLTKLCAELKQENEKLKKSMK